MRIAHGKLKISPLAPLAALAVAALFCAGSAFAQDQDNSIAAAARRAQEAKKDQPKAAKVYDNTNIPSTGGVNVVGQEPPAAGSRVLYLAHGRFSSGRRETRADQSRNRVPEFRSRHRQTARGRFKSRSRRGPAQVRARSVHLHRQSESRERRATAAALDSEKSDIDTKSEAVALAEKLMASAQAKLDEAGKQSAAADKAPQDKSAQDKAASTQPAPAAPATPASSTVPDSDTTTVSR